jgi:hypothetical protein
VTTGDQTRQAVDILRVLTFPRCRRDQSHPRANKTLLALASVCSEIGTSPTSGDVGPKSAMRRIADVETKSVGHVLAVELHGALNRSTLPPKAMPALGGGDGAIRGDYVVRRQLTAYSLQRELSHRLDLHGILDLN